MRPEISDFFGSPRLLRRLSLTSVALLALTASGAPLVFAQQAAKSPAAASDAAPNTLTAAEKAAGWKLLFDGKTTNGWRGFHADAFPAQGWAVEDGAIKRIGKGEKPGSGGDIITTDEYADFELSLDWKLSPGGNSGLKYLIVEGPGTSHAGVGYEMQILDDERHPDAKLGVNGDRTAGALYDLIPPSTHAARPIGEWNQARLVVRGRHVEHWLNGQRVVQFEIGSPEMKTLIARSKYKDIKGFGDATKGHILLQDHGDEVSFRNIKLRQLPAGAQH
jgi:3-keto-disaccharide hydrolase